MASKVKTTQVKEKKVAAKPAAKAKTVAPKVSKAKVVKPVKTATVKAEAPVKVVKAAKETTNAAVSINVVGIDGKVSGKMSLPAEIFGETVNKKLLAQAVRVYLANQRQGNASTKTRGEVDGSTRKIYRQKGTGRARHGGIRAPIFVKGGIVFGPKPRDYSLALPQKMKRKALFSALSAKVKDSQVTVLAGLDGLEPKTKAFVGLLKNLGVAKAKQKLLFVTTASLVSAKRAGQNVQGVTFTDVKQLNAYEVLRTRNLILDKGTIEEMKKQFLGKDK